EKVANDAVGRATASHDWLVDALEEVLPVDALAFLENLVEESQTIGVVVHSVEQQRVQHLAREERRATHAFFGDLGARLTGRGLVAHTDHQHAVGTEPERGRERRVETQAAIAIEALIDTDRWEDERDRGGSERVLRGEVRGASDHERIT